ncbi:MAG: hypothetical protein ACRC92_26025 [Peptostreptococcaceae bacterium]
MIKLIGVRLVNFKIYKETLGLSEVKIDIPEEAVMIVIRAENGGGKTTFIKTIMAGARSGTEDVEDFKDGVKILIHKDVRTGIIYESKFVYTSKGKNTAGHTVKAYMTMKHNGKEEELNPSGLQTSYDALREQKFGINSNTLKLLSLSLDDAGRGVINMTPAERRKYIYSLLPDLDEMDKYGKVVSEKYKDISKELKATTVKLSKFPDIERLKTSLRELRMEYDRLNQAMMNHSEELGKIKSSNESPYELRTEMEKLQNVISSIESTVNKMNDIGNTDIPLSEYISNINNRLLQGKNELEYKQNRMTDLSARLYELKNADTYKAKDKDWSGEIVRLEDMLSSLVRYSEVDHTYDNISKVQLNDLKNFIIRTVNYLDKIDELNINKSNLIDMLDNKESDYPWQQEIMCDTEYAKTDFKLTTVQARINYITEATKDFKELSMPKSCADTSCKLRKFFEDKQNQFKELEKLNDEFIVLEKKRNELSEQIDMWRQYQTAHSRFSNLLNAIDTESELLSLMYKDFKLEVKKMYLSKSYDNLIDYIDDIIHTRASYNEYINVKARLEEVRHFKVLSENSSHEIEKQIKDINLEMEKLETEVSNLIKSNTTLEKIINKVSIDNTNVHVHMDVDTLAIELKKSSDTLTKLESRYKVAVDKDYVRNEIEGKIENIHSKLKLQNEDVMKVNNEINMVETLMSDVDTLTVSERKHKMIRDTLKLTLPSMVMESFLQRVINSANDFLEASESVYRINECKVNDEEFTITISNRGFINPDSTTLSGGEKSLISLAFTFGLQNILLSDFKIMTLDEVDATLDSGNKERYVDILLRQSQVYGIGQIFMITHNESFANHAHDIHVIAFKGGAYDDNMNVIFDANKTRGV